MNKYTPIWLIAGERRCDEQAGRDYTKKIELGWAKYYALAGPRSVDSDNNNSYLERIELSRQLRIAHKPKSPILGAARRVRIAAGHMSHNEPPKTRMSVSGWGFVRDISDSWVTPLPGYELGPVFHRALMVQHFAYRAEQRTGKEWLLYECFPVRLCVANLVRISRHQYNFDLRPGFRQIIRQLQATHLGH